MKKAPEPTQSERYAQELTLLEQVHVALGSASKLDDFYIIMGCMLVDPNIFGFSRAFVLRHDERTRSFAGGLAVGARSRHEHKKVRSEIKHEARRLQEQIQEIQRESPEPRAVQPLYDLRFHSLWIHLLQQQEAGAGLNHGFRQVLLKPGDLGSTHLAERVSGMSRAALLDGRDTDISGLEAFVHFPVVAGRIMTKKGLHGIVIADRAFEDGPVDDHALYHFQWLLNHASVTLDNVELLEELRVTTARLREMDRIKTNFLSIVSHELRTPLTSVVGFVQILQDEKVGPLSRSQRDLLRRVAHHSGHLENMVNDILEIAEVEAGGAMNVELHPVDPLAAALKTIPKVESRRGSKRIDIEPVISDDIPLICADRKALERVFYHLLDNAVKFITSQGTVRIHFKRRDDMLNITIEDTGIGISPENVRKIFDHFYQVDFRLERAYGGMGIGLTVVKLLLEATGGQLSVESTPGLGSRFTVTYPVHQSREDCNAGGI